MSAVEVRKAWKLSDADRNTLLNSLDSGGVGGEAGIDVANRAPFRATAVELAVTYAAGGSAKFCVFGRNIGQKGMSILHAGFLHNHTECHITLPTVWNSKETIAATTVRCRHVSGVTHEVELSFKEPVDLRWFVERGPVLTKLLTQNLDKSNLRGRLLVLDDQAIENELIKHHLRGTSLQVQAVTKPGEAIDLLKTTSFDLILCDLNLGDQLGENVIRQFREMGCVVPILALTGETNAQRLSAATASGASAILEKPVEPQRLLVTLVEWLLESANKSDTGNEPVYSTLAEQPGGSEVVRSFMNYVTRLLTTLTRATEKGVVEEARKVCLALKEGGGTAGFATLSAAATEAMKALDASSSIPESMRQLTAMRSIATRLRAEPAPQRKA